MSESHPSRPSLPASDGDACGASAERLGRSILPIDSYLDPASSPAEPPRLDTMAPRTIEIHRAIDAAIRKSGHPYLHPEGETLQLDLLGSERMVRWQEAKAARVFEGEECWSEQPQVYARYGTETTRALIGRIRALEHARAVTLTDCGMQACALLFDVLVTPRSHAIIGRQTYNKTKKYLERLARLVNGSYTIVDDGDYDAISAAIRDETVVVFFETFTNPLVRALDPSRLGSIVVDARKRGARSLRAVIDSTIATPWSLKKPLLETEGIDFVVASGTKALGGADRDLWGYIASNEVDTLNEIMDLQAMRGGLLDWRRGRAILEGLDGARERFERRSANASRIADFLARHPRVAEVFHPSLASHADRAVIERAYRLPGSLLSFRVDGADEDATRHFSDVLVMTGVPRYALSFDGLTTKVNHHVSVSEYFTPREELERAGIDRIVRIGVGLEEPDDVIACLNWALWRFESVSAEEVSRWQSMRAADLGIYRSSGEG